MDSEIEKNIREYITKTVHLSLATVRENKPWVCEVHFGFDDELNLYFCSKPSTRHCVELNDNKYVAGDIVVQHGLSESPHGVYFEGSAEKIDAPTDAEIHAYAGRLGRNETDLKTQLYDEKTHCLYKITVSNWAIFGKFGLDSNMKHELSWGEKV